MTYNILFRTSGGKSKGKELGFGHIYRTINLAKEFSKEKIFFLLEDFGGAKKIILENGYRNITTVKKSYNLEQDYEKTIDFIKQNNIDLVIFDKYKIDKNYIKKFKQFVKTVVISDLSNINYDSHLLVNGFIGFKNQLITKNSTTFLLGPKYQILDPKFKIMKAKNRSRKKFKKLLITVGGYDENNIIELFLKSISKNILFFDITLVLGPATCLTKNLRLMKKNFSNNIKIILSTNNMKKEISNCDFGICSGGLTSYEFATLGKPFALICQSSHQILTAREWEHHKIAYNLGYPNNRIHSKIKILLENLLSNNINLRTKSVKFLDGKGSLRVSQKIYSLLKN
ncbi:UDP-2,4-diacetamido-2,4,6-trideoxy-beta-L-altropyranose hydrolase [Nitrosopumilus sp.]|uniref:UDP-2,4-diacetamido-2,4, 6-trideoxy-beta-L-altropyranose hydrolase n=1 Tax=Nitrosopumilus sp. TaxID=2024843 RepID=UPI00247D59B8|nr:UDP-2,4-diacetamido-2,4,6-trideoxy-beta-L-altropyranose hydrolase [Nitrosopumilus sp.]MCV0430377.1 UDP-2,4-diacetamido-2,4,6-trideoxy-beta-L-altropyranose hydrolase [Nitrosopumilus sp.]